MKRLPLLFILLLQTLSAALPAAFTAAPWTLAGSAVSNQGGVVVLTPELGFQFGGAWNPCSININQAFDLTFALNFGNESCGADGLAFVLQNDSFGVGSNPGAHATDAFTHSVSIFFDTYANTVGPYFDPVYDSIGIRVNGQTQAAGPASCGGTGQVAGPTGCTRPTVRDGQYNMKDGAFHQLRFTWDPTTRLMEVWYVGEPVYRAQWELPASYVADFFNNNANVRFGFTAATGGSMNVHQIALVGGTVNGGTNVTALSCAAVPTATPVQSPTAVVLPAATCGSPTPMPTFTVSPTTTPTFSVSPTPYPPGCGVPIFQEARVIASGCINAPAIQSHPYSFTSQPNQLLVVRMTTSNTTTNPSSVQFGGSNMTLHSTHNVGGSDSNRMHTYYLANPPATGPLTFVFANANCSWNIVTELWRNVNTLAPVGAYNTKQSGTAGGSSPFPFSFNMSTTGFASVVSVHMTADQAAGAPPTSLAPQVNMNLGSVGPSSVDGGGGHGVAGFYYTVNGAGSYTFNYNGTQANRWWDAVPIEIQGNQCETPTNSPSPSITLTRTPTNTPSATRTASPSPSSTPTASPSASPSPTRTASPSPSGTPTASPTRTATATGTPTPSPSDTPSPSVTDTVVGTFTHTPTRTDSPTATPTATETNTYTYTATRTNTATHTPSSTETSTFSPTPTPSATPTVTASATETNTFSPTPTPSDTRTATASATQSNTHTATPTATASASPTPSATQTNTFSATPTPTNTRTASPTATESATPSPTRTITETFTVSPTHSPSPVPAPNHLVVGAYNSAGELVRLLFDGQAQALPSALDLSAGVLVNSDPAGLGILIPGALSQGGAQQYGLVWALDNSGGQRVGGGVYYIKAEFADPFGTVSSFAKSVQVIEAPGGDEVRIYNGAGELVWSQSLSYTVTAIDLPNGAAFAPEFSASGASVGGPLGLRVVDAAGGSHLLPWDGRSAQGRPLSAGTYLVQVTHEGTGGASLVQARSVTLIKAPGVSALAGALMAPNPVVRQGVARFTYPAQPSLRVVCELYNISGEKVLVAAESVADGSLDLPVGALASGVYVVKAQLLGGTALVDQRVLKLALVR